MNSVDEGEPMPETDDRRAGCRRPAYVWAQNHTHIFVTVSLSRAEREAAPKVDCGQRHLQVHASRESGADCVEITLELYRPIETARCQSQRTNRGLLLRAPKQGPGHWRRLLLRDEYDAKQSVDWSRFSHPDATRAEEQERREADFAALDAVRMREMARLRPRFDAMLRDFAAAQERSEVLDPQRQHEMLVLGEAILKHYHEERSERAALRGDAPLPAGVDEVNLERSVLKLRELDRKGQLDHDRNTESWKEWRRRRAGRTPGEKKKAI